MSGAAAVFVGVDTVTEDQQRLRDNVAKNPCLAVFGPEGWSDDRVPIAVFTDYNCPYCPILSDLVIGLEAEGVPIRPIWHDLPVLGPRSEAAALAAIAAGQQDAYLPVHEYLMRTVLRPGPGPLVRIAETFGLDSEQFQKDVKSRPVAQKIEQSEAIAAVFGLIGTPATIVGRTVVVGDIDRDTLLRLIEIESSEPFDGCSQN